MTRDCLASRRRNVRFPLLIACLMIIWACSNQQVATAPSPEPQSLDASAAGNAKSGSITRHTYPAAASEPKDGGADQQLATTAAHGHRSTATIAPEVKEPGSVAQAIYPASTIAPDADSSVDPMASVQPTPITEANHSPAASGDSDIGAPILAEHTEVLAERLETDTPFEGVPPCSATSKTDCTPREVAPIPSESSAAPAWTGGYPEHVRTVEEVMAQVHHPHGKPGFLPNGERVVQMAVRGSVVPDSHRCAWTRVAKNKVFYGGRENYEPYVNSDGSRPTFDEAVANLRAFREERGIHGLSDAFLTQTATHNIAGGYYTYDDLVCFVDVRVFDYILGSGPDRITVAFFSDFHDSYPRFEFMDDFALSYEAINGQRSEFSEMSRDRWERIRMESIARNENSIAKRLSRFVSRETVFLLSPFSDWWAHIETLQAVGDAWDIQERDGEVIAMRHGTVGWTLQDDDPEHLQTLERLEERIKAFAETIPEFEPGMVFQYPVRITNVAHLDEYGMMMGTYDAITPALPPPPYTEAQWEVKRSATPVPTFVPATPSPKPPWHVEDLQIKTGSDLFISLYWEHPVEKTVDSYEVLRRLAESEEGFSVVGSVPYGHSRSFHDEEGLMYGTEYEYLVRAVNETGRSKDSEIVRIATAPIPEDAGVPEAPTGLTARAVLHAVILEWEPPPARKGVPPIEIVGYEILRLRVPDRELERHVRNTRSVETTYVDEDDLDPSATYAYAVRALTKDERGETSHHVKVDTGIWGFDEPTAVTGFKAEARDGGVALSWDLHDDHSIDEFLIERIDVESGTSHAIGLIYAHRGHVFYFDDGVEPGKTYEYVIKAANHHGAGDGSEPVRVTVRSPSP